MKAYKAFDMIDDKMMCVRFVYEIGETYTLEEKLIICKNGFHACKTMENVFWYYSTKSAVCEVEILGDIQEKGDKICTNKIKIIRQLSKEEILANIKSPHFAYLWARDTGNQQEQMSELIDNSKHAYLWARDIGTHKKKMIKLIYDDQEFVYLWKKCKNYESI